MVTGSPQHDADASAGLRSVAPASRKQKIQRNWKFELFIVVPPGSLERRVNAQVQAAVEVVGRSRDERVATEKQLDIVGNAVAIAVATACEPVGLARIDRSVSVGVLLIVRYAVAIGIDWNAARVDGDVMESDIDD